MIPFIAVAFHIYTVFLYYTLAVGGFIHIRYKLSIIVNFLLTTNSIFTKLSGYLDIDIMLLLKAHLSIFMLKLLREIIPQIP